MASFSRRPNVLLNRDAPTCFWAAAQVPYKPPGQGDDGEKFVEFTLSKSGDRVKIAQAFVGHYPQLCQIEGTLTNRAGRAWAVLFDGFEKEMLFNVDAGMRQLIHVQIEVDGKKVDKHLSRQELDILYWGKGVFQKLDVNQDGKLSATELAKTLKALPKTKPPNCAPDTKFQSLQEMISVLDANHDGFVDQQEWLENLGKCAGFYEALAEMKKNERVQQVLRERQEMEG